MSRSLCRRLCHVSFNAPLPATSVRHCWLVREGRRHRDPVLAIRVHDRPRRVRARCRRRQAVSARRRRGNRRPIHGAVGRRRDCNRRGTRLDGNLLCLVIVLVEASELVQPILPLFLVCQEAVPHIAEKFHFHEVNIVDGNHGHVRPRFVGVRVIVQKLVSQHQPYRDQAVFATGAAFDRGVELLKTVDEE